MLSFRRQRIKPIYFVPAIIALGLLSGLLWFVIQKNAPPPASPNISIASADKPSEKPVKKNEYHSTARGEEPKYITLPSIKAEGFIDKVGIDQHQQVGAPKNINLAGWFIGSAKPGEKGLSVIDGHVDGLSDKGIFWPLKQLKKGDKFEIERADGKKLVFEVLALQSVKTEEAVGHLFSQDPKVASQLNLITCSGSFDRRAEIYEERLIVTSQLVSES